MAIHSIFGEINENPPKLTNVELASFLFFKYRLYELTTRKRDKKEIKDIKKVSPILRGAVRKVYELELMSLDEEKCFNPKEEVETHQRVTAIRKTEALIEKLQFKNDNVKIDYPTLTFKKTKR